MSRGQVHEMLQKRAQPWGQGCPHHHNIRFRIDQLQQQKRLRPAGACEAAKGKTREREQTEAASQTGCGIRHSADHSMAVLQMTAIRTPSEKDSLLHSVLVYESLKATAGLLQEYWQVFPLPRYPDL